MRPLLQRMETKGLHVFSRNDKVPAATVLGRVISKGHNAVKKKDLRKPWRAAEITWLIHPSPVSGVALDFVFQTETGVFSPFSSSLFAHLDDLKNAFVLYALGDLLFSLERDRPELFAGSVSVNDVPIAQFVIDSVVRKLNAAVDETNFIARIERVSDVFDRAVKIFLTLGVAPVSKSDNRYRSFTPVKGDIVGYIDTYVSFLESAVNIFSVIETDVLLRNTVLTVRNGTYGCTDYAGVPYVLWTFGRVPTSFKAGFASRPPLLSMMQYEYQYMFANARHRHQAIEKMTKTSVVVSSTLTTEAEAVLETTRKGQQLFNPLETIQSIEKDREKLDILEMKAKSIKMVADGPSSADDSMFNVKRQLTALEAAVEINSTLEKSLHKHFNRLKSKTVEHDEDEDQYTPSVVQERGMIHGAGPEWRKKEIVDQNRVVQQKLLTQKIRKMKSEIVEYQREAGVLREELTSMIQNQAKLDFQIKMKQTKIEMVGRNLAEMTKERDRATTTLKKYEALIDNMKETVANALSETNASETERNKLLKMFTHVTFSDAGGQGLDTKYEFCQNSKCLFEFLHLILGDDARTEKKNGADDEETDTTEYAYEKMLKDRGVFVLPFFTGVQNRAILDAYNYWLPYDWMHDKPMEPFSKDGHTTMDMAGRQAVTNTPELYILDVNPKTAEETSKVRRAIDVAGGTTLLDSVFQRTFLNVQFPVQGSVEESINAHLKEKWHHLIGKLLHLSGETFTKNGQRVGARVSTASINVFIAPFFAQYMGQRGYARRLPTLVADFMDNVGTPLKEAGYTAHEKLTYCFCCRKIAPLHYPTLEETDVVCQQRKPVILHDTRNR